MAKSKKTDPTLSLVDQVVKAFNSSWSYRSASWHPIWQDMQRLYDSERVYVGYRGISDTFVPMCFSTVETMVAATSGDKPLVEYVPTKPEQQTNTEVLNGLFAYYWDLDGWTPKLTQHSRILFKLGTSVIRAYWNIDHPCLDIIPMRDFFCDPNATFFNQENAAYMGHRFLASKKRLEEEQIIDPETGEMVPKYKNLDKLGAPYDSGEATAKQEKDKEMGSATEGDLKGDQIEVICYETLEKVIYVGNRSQVIYENDNYFKQRQQFLGYENPTGMFSYVVDALSPDEAQLYGKSVIQPIAKPQELLNDLTNQNVDAVSWALDPEMELDPQYSSYLDKMTAATGNVYPFKPGSYQAVNKPLMPNGVFNERTNIKNEIREATAVDQVVKGIQAQGETTATEVKAQVASAGRRFELIISMLENGGYYRLAKLVFQMIQLYVTTPTMYRVLGKDGVDWQTYDPEMFKGDYEPRIKLKATLDKEKQMKTRDVKEMYAALLGSPFVNQAELTKFVIQKGFNLEPDDAADLVVPEEQAAQMAGAEQKTKETPEEIALAAVGKAYGKTLSPDISAQLEELAGLEPSVTHEGAMETMATQQMADQAMNGEQIAPVPTTAPQAMTTMQSQGVPVGQPSGQ